MTVPRRPPSLLFKTLAVTFVTVALLLLAVFLVVTVTVRRQVRDSVTASLEAGSHVFAGLESRRQRELVAQAATLAENPTLKAALDTYRAEARTINEANRAVLFETIDRVLGDVAARIDVDALVLVESQQGKTIAAAGRLAARWPRGEPVTIANNGSRFDGIARMGGAVFRTVAVPVTVDNVGIATLYLATMLDQKYAENLAGIAGTGTAVISNGVVVASTLSPAAAKAFESQMPQLRAAGSFTDASPPGGMATLDGEEYAYRRLVSVGDTAFYALGSIDASSRGPTRNAMRNLGLIGVGAIALALAGSFWLARLLAEPIGELSASLAAMAQAHTITARLTPRGSSREVDALTETFNALMSSLAAAEEQTQAAYTGAIRALAAALDARDTYTAGHSERVSVISVAMGRALSLSNDDLEIVRLGALLHDIGKIGVPDEVLRKPSRLTEAEYEIIKQHPVLGARILRSVPFLAPHLPIVELHHERPDGRGYPKGLRGDDIPIAARIVHVADAYDAMTSARAYRHGRPSSEALKELWRCAGTEFHADIVEALVTALPGVTSDSGDVLLAQEKSA